MTAEHLHLAINHIPFLGSAFAFIPILLGILTKNRVTMMSGLLLAAVAGWMTPLVMESGEEAYERYEDGPVKPYLDANAEHFLEEHEETAETWSKVFYVSAVISTIALLILFRSEKYGRYFAMAAAVLCLASLLAGIWISQTGGRIRRPDFREPATSTLSTGPEHSQKVEYNERD